MARPKSLNPRGKQLNIALRPEEFDAVRDRADALGKRPVDFARDTLIGGDPGTVPSIARFDRLVLEQLKRVGSNLNQIARQLNALGPVSLGELEQVLRELRDLLRRMG